MNYFQPKSFLEFGRLRHNKWRLGSFEVKPVYENYATILYWTSSTEKDNGKFVTSYWRHTPNGTHKSITSPEFDSEEKAIRWLEKALSKVVIRHVKDENNKLFKNIKSNLAFIKPFKK